METKRKFSRKREEIYNALLSSKEHPSAEWLYGKLKPQMPDLSLGTVYRNISMFKEEGRIVSVGVVNGQERFDACTEPHAHFICDACGRVLDLEVPEDFGGLYREISSKYGVAVSSHRLEFHGACPDCAGRSA